MNAGTSGSSTPATHQPVNTHVQVLMRPYAADSLDEDEVDGGDDADEAGDADGADDAGEVEDEESPDGLRESVT